MENFEKKFNNPQEEISYLREQIKQQETKENIEKVENYDEEISNKIDEYKRIPSDRVISEDYKIAEEEKEKIVLNLSPEKHDDVMNELLGILEERGIKNTLSVLEKMGNPHIEDDFHRILVQYVKTGYIDKVGEKEKVFYQNYETILYEITFPSFKGGDSQKSLESIIAPMEQFYQGMLSVTNSYFTIEISVANGSSDLIMYMNVPRKNKDLFEKQILAVFPEVSIKENPNDYNIFKEGFKVLGSGLSLYKKQIFPIKDYTSFSVDPLEILLSSLSKLSEDEGASIQLVVDTSKNNFNRKYQKILERVQGGLSVKEAFKKENILIGLGEYFLKSSSKPEISSKVADQETIESIKNKISSPILNTNIRLVVSAESEQRAQNILDEIKSSFSQFNNPLGNNIIFKDFVRGKGLKKFLRNYSFRRINKKDFIALNLKELSSIFHFYSSHIKSSAILKQSKSTTSSAPRNISSQKGILLGKNNYHGVETEIRISEEDRMRHFYVIGQTGTGKTTLLKNMITQDILEGKGVCMIDPHGSDIDDILSIIPPERYEDVIYFDPADTQRVFTLNMLEYDKNHPEQKTFVVDEMLSIFNKLFDMKTAGGPMFEQYFRQAVLLVIDNPESGNTLEDISRVLSDKKFREMKLSVCKNENVIRFWRDIADQAGGDASLKNIVPYITSKFDIFLSNEIMGPIVSKSKSSFNFREIMDGKKILLVNLSKGRLGEINSNLIGLIVVGKLLMASLSRVGSDPAHMNPFFLYIDEFQNVTTDSISSILSEARKYKLSLTVAHQFIKQLDEEIKNSVFGNVGSMAVFRVGADDAEYLEKQFSPTFSTKDILELDNYNAYVKMLVGGQPAEPFSLKTDVPMEGEKEKIEKIKELSFLIYGKNNL